MQNRFPLRALLLASAVAVGTLAPAAWAETPADTLVVAAQIDGNFRHFVVTLVPVKAPKVEKPKPQPKKKK